MLVVKHFSVRAAERTCDCCPVNELSAASHIVLHLNRGRTPGEYDGTQQEALQKNRGKQEYISH